MRINGQIVDGEYFAYNGRNKFYICKTWDERREAESYGYKIYDIHKLRDMYEICTDPLKFIHPWDLQGEYVAQGDTANFDNDSIYYAVIENVFGCDEQNGGNIAENKLYQSKQTAIEYAKELAEREKSEENGFHWLSKLASNPTENGKYGEFEEDDILGSYIYADDWGHRVEITVEELIIVD